MTPGSRHCSFRRQRPANAERDCFHCGLPLPAVSYSVVIDGAAHDTCCRGCQAVAQTIVDNGLASYYRHRTVLPQAQPSNGDDILAQLRLYDLPEIQRGFVREADAGEHGKEASLLLDGITCAACVWLIEQRLARLAGRARGRGELRDAARARALGRAPHPPERHPARGRGPRLRRAAVRQRALRRCVEARAPRDAVAPVRRRLRHDAGDDVRGAGLHRGRRHDRGPRAADAHREPGADGAGRGVGGRAVLRRRVARAEGAPRRHGRAGRARHHRGVRGERARDAARRRPGLLRFDLDVRVSAARRALSRDGRAREGRPRRRSVSRGSRPRSPSA